MIIRLTGACNNRCPFCLVEDEIRQGLVRPADEIHAEIDGVDPDEQIDIFGGEPTINPHFWQILDHALATGRRVSLATNCRLFANDAAVQRLAAAGLSRIDVRTSVLGHEPELHDRLNGVRGHAFDQTIAGIERLSEAGFAVQVNVVLLADNIDFIAPTVERAINAGASSIKLSGLVQTDAVRAMVPDPQRVRQVLPLAIATAQARGASIRLEKFTPCLTGSHLALLQREHDPHSGIGWFEKREACRGCALEQACAGAEKGAIAVHGDDWLAPYKTIPGDLVRSVPISALDLFTPANGRPVARLELPEEPDELLELLPKIASFRFHNPHLFILV